MTTKKTNSSPEPSDFQKLILEFEEVQSDLVTLALSDKEEQEVLAKGHRTLEELAKNVEGILSGNKRARRERLVKLTNLQELLRPILFPMIGGQDNLLNRDCPTSAYFGPM